MTATAAPRALTADQARAMRLRSLLLGPRAGDGGAPGVLGVTTWFGALQGQDVRSLLWSLGVRLPGSTLSTVREALERREVVRTWPMRGTLHLVPAADARWMVQLMAGRQGAAAVTRRRQLGLAEPDVDRAVELLGTALAGGGRLTRAECVTLLASAGLTVAGQASYHLIAEACKRGVVGMAPEIGADQTFVLLDDWAPGQRIPERDEALATVALRYVRSHGPAQRRDLAGWTGLTLADVDRGVAAAGDQLCRVRVDDVEMIAPGPEPEAGLDDAGVPAHLALPGFDEYMLGYKDRSLLLSPAHFQAVVPGGNGVFRATLVRHGRVVGTWTRTITRGRLIVHAVRLSPLAAADVAEFERALVGYAGFLEVTGVDVRWE